MNRRKKIALMTLPVLALVVMGSSVASAYGNRTQELTEEQESALEEAYALRTEGERDQAREVLKRAGIPHLVHRGLAQRANGHEGQDQIYAAIDAHDYTAFKNLTIDAPFAPMVTEESFAKLVEAHALRKVGDKAGAEQILKDLGFPRHGKGSHRYMHSH